MDAVPFIIATKGADVNKPEEQYDMLRKFREFLQWRQGDSIVLAEANVLPETDMEYFGDDGDRMHMMFNFQVNQNLFYALASADTGPLIKALQATKPRPATAQWGLFLRNHDELDLGRLTDEQRQKVFAAFGPDKDMQLYDRGIRRRLAPMLDGDQRRLELAYSLLFTLARHAGHPLRRRTRHGRRSEPAGARMRAHADAMVERAAWRLHQERQSALPGDQRRPLRLRAHQRRDPAPSPGFAAELDRAHHPHAQGGAGNRLGRFHGDPDAAIPPCWSCATTGATTRCCSCTISTRKPREIASRLGLKGDDAEHGKLLVNLLAEDHSQADDKRQAHAGHRGLRLSLVPRRRPGLPAAAHRDRRHACHRPGIEGRLNRCGCAG